MAEGEDEILNTNTRTGHPLSFPFSLYVQLAHRQVSARDRPAYDARLRLTQQKLSLLLFLVSCFFFCRVFRFLILLSGPVQPSVLFSQLLFLFLESKERQEDQKTNKKWRTKERGGCGNGWVGVSEEGAARCEMRLSACLSASTTTSLPLFSTSSFTNNVVIPPSTALSLVRVFLVF